MYRGELQEHTRKEDKDEKRGHESLGERPLGGKLRFIVQIHSLYDKKQRSTNIK